jgi:hypothetical protein
MSESDDEQYDEARQKAATIRKSFSTMATPLANRTAANLTTPAPRQTPVNCSSEEKLADMAMSVATAGMCGDSPQFGSLSGTPNTSSAHKATPVAQAIATAASSPSPSQDGDRTLESLEEGLPKSLAEIYKLSSKSRKRNKQRQKKSGEVAMAACDDEDTKATRKKAKANSTGADDVVEFMSSVGWPTASKTEARFTPFDYDAKVPEKSAKADVKEFDPHFTSTAAEPNFKAGRSKVRPKTGWKSATFGNSPSTKSARPKAGKRQH